MKVGVLGRKVVICFIPPLLSDLYSRRLIKLSTGESFLSCCPKKNWFDENLDACNLIINPFFFFLESMTVVAMERSKKHRQHLNPLVSAKASEANPRFEVCFSWPVSKAVKDSFFHSTFTSIRRTYFAMTKVIRVHQGCLPACKLADQTNVASNSFATANFSSSMWLRQRVHCLCKTVSLSKLSKELNCPL